MRVLDEKANTSLNAGNPSEEGVAINRSLFTRNCNFIIWSSFSLFFVFGGLAALGMFIPCEEVKDECLQDAEGLFKTNLNGLNYTCSSEEPVFLFPPKYNKTIAFYLEGCAAASSGYSMESNSIALFVLSGLSLCVGITFCALKYYLKKQESENDDETNRYQSLSTSGSGAV